MSKRQCKHSVSDIAIPYNTSIIPIIVIVVYLLGVLAIVCRAENQVDNTQGSMMEKSDVKKGEKHLHPETLKRVSEIGGEVLIDGSLRVTAPTFTLVEDLVEVSTPVASATNHARIFLRADGTKQSLVVMFDDATFVKIAGN